MALPDSYVYTPDRVQAYFDAILNANPPERFTVRFLEGLEFKSVNDRLLIGVLKELGFLDQDGVPKQRYFEFLDRSQSAMVLAEAIRETYSDLFNVFKDAHRLSRDEVKNKLRTLYMGSKTDKVIGSIAATFLALCSLADFSQSGQVNFGYTDPPPIKVENVPQSSTIIDNKPTEPKEKTLGVNSLQYHINIVLPESSNQAVYDAIFKSMKEHLS